MKLKTFFLSLVVCFQFTTTHSSAQVCFSPYLDFPMSNGSWAIITADFNLDGNPDVATANYYSNNFSVRLGNGAGGFGAATSYSSFQDPYALTSGDFNNDGKPDIAVANAYSSDISVRLGNGLGGFGAATLFSIPNVNPEGIGSADFNSDGKQDLLTCNNTTGDVALLLGNGLGSFGAATYTQAAFGGLDAMVIADLNADGKPDVAVTSAVLNTVIVLIRNGTTSFATPTTYTVGTSPDGITAADVNGDGKLDLATANQSSADVSVLLNNGTGGFGTPVNYVVGGVPYKITSGDFNGDGSIDLATANYTTDKVAVLLNNGSGVFGTHVDYATNTGPSWLCSADFNADGKKDIAVACNQAYSVCLLLNAPAPALTINASATTVCSGSPVTLTASGAPTISWSGGVTNGVPFTPTAMQTYTVTGVDANACKDSTYVTVDVVAPATPDICMVTVDFPSNYNRVYWDKTPYTNVDSFIVHREVATNTYFPVGAVAYADSSYFIDTARSIGPANGDPNITSYRYKLQIKDTCGNVGGLSPYHTSVYFNDLMNGTFTWNSYMIEGQGTTPMTFTELQRDDNNTGAFNLVAAAAGTTTTLNDPNYITYQNTAVWRVYMNGITCTPTLKLVAGNNIQTTVTKSRTNTRNNRLTGIKENSLSSCVTVMPQPAEDYIVVQLDKTMLNATVELYSPLGALVKNENMKNTSSLRMNLEGYNSGIYLLVISTEKGRIVKKLVKQ